MYEAQVLERERSAQSASQYDNAAYSRNVYNNNYTQRVAPINRPVQNMTPNFMPNYASQNEYYVQPQSDNINMNYNPYDASTMSRTASNFAQAPVYMPSYYSDTQAYNNVSVNAHTHPTNYYFPNQVQGNYYHTQEPIKTNNDMGYEIVEPAKRKTKNKMTKMLIAVYFLIIAVCAALILINVVAAAGASEVAAATTAEAAPAYVENAVYYSVSEDGTINAIEQSQAVVNYSYDVSTNWFDKLCDKVGEFLG